MSLEGGEVPVEKDVVTRSTSEIPIVRVIEDTRRVAFEKMNAATDLPGYLQWHHAGALTFSAPGIECFMDDETSTEELTKEMLTMASNEDAQNHARREAEIVEKLKKKLDSMPVEENMCRFAVTKIDGSNEFRVLAALPAEAVVIEPLDGIPEFDGDGSQKDGVKIVYYAPERVCTTQACEALLEEHGTEPFAMPYKPLLELKDDLERSPDGVYHFDFINASGERVIQKKEPYALYGVLGGYPEEDNVTRVSDFWNKQAQIL